MFRHRLAKRQLIVAILLATLALGGGVAYAIITTQNNERAAELRAQEELAAEEAREALEDLTDSVVAEAKTTVAAAEAHLAEVSAKLDEATLSAYSTAVDALRAAAAQRDITGIETATAALADATAAADVAVSAFEAAAAAAELQAAADAAAAQDAADEAAAQAAATAQGAVSGGGAKASTGASGSSKPSTTTRQDAAAPAAGSAAPAPAPAPAADDDVVCNTRQPDGSFITCGGAYVPPPPAPPKVCPPGTVDNPIYSVCTPPPNWESTP